MFASNSRSRQTGMSLVSVMVGLVISTLVGLSALGSLQMFSVAQRQAAGVESAAQTGVLISAALRQELSQAGRGLAPLLACGGVNVAVDGEVLADGAAVSPLQVTFSEEGALQLDIWYGDRLEGLTPVPLSTGLDKGVATLGRRVWASKGQAVLLAPPEGATTPCAVRTVTATVLDVDAASQTFTLGDSGAFNGGKFTTEDKFPANSTVSVLGDLTHTRVWHEGTQLRMAQPLSDRTAVLANDVVGFAVQWGVQTGGTEQLRWVAPAADKASGEDWRTLDASNLGQLRAVRLGVVIRTPQTDRAPGKACTASTAKPVLFGEELTLDDSWACFKYRTAIVAVPLRNIGA